MPQCTAKQLGANQCQLMCKIAIFCYAITTSKLLVFCHAFLQQW